ncbi:MAG: amidohydrolase family protein [Candidatus Methanomethylicia archaeon]
MIIDSHMHMGSVSGASINSISGEYLVSIMDMFNIDYGFVTSLSSSLKHNKIVMGEVLRFPNRFIGFYWVNPMRNSILEEVSKVVGKGFMGIKLRPETDGYSLFNISMLQPVLDFAMKMELIVYVHCSGFGVSHANAFNTICDLYPDLKVIIGHMAQGSLEAIKAAVKHDNILLETSTYHYEKFLLYAIKTLGSNRILFGSDFPYSNVSLEISKIIQLNIPMEDKYKILGGNASLLLPSH